MANGNKHQMTSSESYKLEQRMYQMLINREFKKDDLEMFVGFNSDENSEYVKFHMFQMIIDDVQYEVYEDKFVDEIDYGRQWYHTHYFTFQPLKDIMHGIPLLSDDAVNALPDSMHTVECKTIDYDDFLYLKIENPEWQFSMPVSKAQINVHCPNKNDAVELKLKFN